MTKPIIVVKMPGYKLQLYIIQVKGFSWPYGLPDIKDFGRLLLDDIKIFQFKRGE